MGDGFACLTTGGVDVECAGAFAGATLPAPVVELGAGEAHVCALTDAGEVHCWGDNQLGQLGTGSNASSDQPVLASLGSLRATAVETGTNHSCALIVDEGGAERLACWGQNDASQICGNCGQEVVFQPRVLAVP